MLHIDTVSKVISRKTICEDITMSIHPNTIIALLGSNGAGKSTTFHMISGLTHVSSGRIQLDERDITNLSLYQRALIGIGYLPQQVSVFERMTVAQNIACILETNPLFPCKISQTEQLNKLLCQFQLQPIANTLAACVSGGEKRRTEIARMLAKSPSYLLLDEPFAGVDPKSILEIKQLIKQLQQQTGTGVLISDHNAQETLDLADYVYVMHQGRILASGTSSEIRSNRDVIRHYLGEKSHAS